MGATAACRNDRCEFDCLSGRRCLDRCIAAEQPCDGQCLPGFANCRDLCVPAALIGPEICDGKDNDCNGAIDDDIVAKPCAPACAGGQACVAGAWSTSSCARIDSDAKSCGTMCTVCPGPQRGKGQAVCLAGECSIKCQPPAKPIAGGCGCVAHSDCPANNVCAADGSCKPQPPVIRLVSAIYGKSCDGRPAVALPPGTTFDQTAHIARMCNGLASCAYKVDHTVIGDPAVGCAKDYRAVWECVSGATVTRRMASLAAEASGMTIQLSCP